MVNNKARCELAVHFNSKPHILGKIRFVVIEQIRSTVNVDDFLNKREAFWIAQLWSIHPFRLNKRKELAL